jgi:hypothetical protein
VYPPGVLFLRVASKGLTGFETVKEMQKSGNGRNENKGVSGSLFVFSGQASVKRMEDGMEEKDLSQSSQRE